MTGSFMDRLHPPQHVHPGERVPTRFVARFLQSGLDFVAHSAHDGDTIVVADEYLKQMVESQAVALGLDLIVEVDRSLLPP